jgi:putative transposase
MMAVNFQGAHFPQDSMLTCVRGSVASPLRTRQVEALMQERGVSIDHATVNRWGITYSPPLEEAFHRRKRPVRVSWRRDETSLKVKGEWRYLYRAVDTQGQTVAFLRTEPRDQEAARRMLTQALRHHGVPEQMTMDGREANAAASKRDHEAHGTTIDIRQSKDLHHLGAQDHRAVKRITRPMLGFTSFAAAHATRVGIERMPMRKKRQLVAEEGSEGLTAAEPFSARAASSPHQQGQLPSHRLHTKICDRAVSRLWSKNGKGSNHTAVQSA